MKINKKMKIIIGTEQNGIVAGKPPMLVVNGVKTLLKQVSHSEVLCEQDTSYFGEALDSKRVYESPYGLIERHYECWGAGLEHSKTRYRLIPNSDIADIQREAVTAA